MVSRCTRSNSDRSSARRRHRRRLRALHHDHPVALADPFRGQAVHLGQGDRRAGTPWSAPARRRCRAWPPGAGSGAPSRRRNRPRGSCPARAPPAPARAAGRSLARSSSPGVKPWRSTRSTSRVSASRPRTTPSCLVAASLHEHVLHPHQRLGGRARAQERRIGGAGQLLQPPVHHAVVDGLDHVAAVVGAGQRAPPGQLVVQADRGGGHLLVLGLDHQRLLVVGHRVQRAARARPAGRTAGRTA